MSGFIRLPRSLRTDPQWREFTSKERHVFEEIYHRAAYSIIELDDHGKMIVLHPGQLLTTFRQLSDWCNDSRPSDWCDEKQPEKIVYFDKDFVRRLIHKLERCKKVRQEVRHIKTILTITCEGFVVSDATGCATRVRQDCDKIATQTKKDKKEKKEKKTNKDSLSVSVCPINDPKENMEDKLLYRTFCRKGAGCKPLKEINDALLSELFTQDEIDYAIGLFQQQNPKVQEPISYLKSMIINIRKENQDDFGTSKHRNNKNHIQRELPNFTESSIDWGYLRK